MTPRRIHVGGFTLIEVLVSLALMAMIATILLTSLQVAGHAWRHVTRTSINSDEISQAQQFLSQHLGSLYPYERVVNGVSQPALFLSDGTSVEFSAPAPEATRNGLLRYRISVNDNSLDVHSQVDRGGAPLGSLMDGDSQPILSWVAGMRLQFLLKDELGRAHWVDHWPDSSRLPLLLRIDIRFPDKDVRRWPSLYVEPRVNTAASCVFDVVSRNCRNST